MDGLECCICGCPCKSIAPGGQLYCGPRGQCMARVFVIYSTDAENLWAKAHVKAPRATYVRARTCRGERMALHTVRRAKPDTILRITGREWRVVS